MDNKDNKEESGWGAWVIRKISNNITILVKNVNIALEHKGKLCSVEIEEISISSCNHLWEEAFVDPGKFNFMRKFCSIKGLQISLEDSLHVNHDDEDEKMKNLKTKEPVLKSLDVVVRLVLIKERLSSDLPDNRVDILCLNTPSVSCTVDQYNSIIQILQRLLAFRKKKDKKKLNKDDENLNNHSKIEKKSKHELHSSYSTPNVSNSKKDIQPPNSPATNKKGWFSWVVSTLTEEQEAEVM